MLNVYAIRPGIVAIESEGSVVTCEVSKCSQWSFGLALNPDTMGATQHVANHIRATLSLFTDAQLIEPKAQPPAKPQTVAAKVHTKGGL